MSNQEIIIADKDSDLKTITAFQPNYYYSHK